MNIDFYPANTKQKKFMESDKRFILLSGSVGSGKSLPICQKIFMFGLIYPGNRILLCRKESTSLKASTLVTLLEQVIPSEMIVSYDKVEGIIKFRTQVPGITSSIVLSGLDKKADNNYPTKIGSTEYGAIAVDEISELSEEDFQALSSRLRYKIPRKTFLICKRAGFYPEWLTYEMFDEQMVRQMFGATNPEGPTHFLYRMFFEEKDEDREVICSSVYENPYADKKYIKALESTLTGLRRERLLYGKWVQAEGIIYDCFENDKNVIDINLSADLMKYKYFFGGADSNFPLPRAGLICATTTDEVHILDEFYQEGTHPEDLGQWFSDFGTHYKNTIDVFHDPSDPEAIVKINAYPGVTCDKAMNPVLPGIDVVYRYLETGKLKVSSKCKTVIRHLQSYKWKKDEQPDKRDDHLMDALRYAIFTYENRLGGNSNPIPTF